MRLPQSLIRSFSAYRFHFQTIGIALLLLSSVPISFGESESALVCSPCSLRYGSVDIGKTETLLVTLTNSGSSSVTLTEITSINSAFVPTKLSLPLILEAGQSVDLSVSFTPTATGWAGGSVKISSNASNSTLVLQLGGTGGTSEPVTATPSALSFGDVATGASASLSVVLTNAQSSSVTLSAIQTTGSEFSVSGPAFPLTLRAGQSVALSVSFSPQTLGTVGGSLFAFGPRLNIPLTGTGTTMTQYSVSLWWNSTLDAVGYNLYRSTSATGTYSKINGTLEPNTAYTDSTVVGGNTYYYAATSVNSGGQESPRSTPPVEAVVP